MKRYTILMIFLLVGLIVKAQYRGQYFEALNYFELGDSTVTVWGKDTLTNPAMVRQIIDDTDINSDSALWADTSGYALNTPTDSLYNSDTKVWLSNGDTIPKADSTRSIMTADTIKINEDGDKTGQIYSGDDALHVVGVGQSMEIESDGSILIQPQSSNLLISTDTIRGDGTNFTTTYSAKLKNFFGRLFQGDKAILDTLIVDGDTATGFIDLKEAVEAESFDKLQFNQTGQLYSEGTLFYDSTEKSISFYNNISGFKEEFGRGVNIRFYTNTGSLITNGTVIRSVGVHKNSAINFLGDLAGNASLDSILGVAVTTVDVPDGEHGMATVLGQVNGLNTSMYSDNDIIYVGHAGAFTNVPPEPPLWYQILGRVVYADNDSGAIYIKTGETKYSPAPTFTARFEDSTETITNPGLGVYELITSATNSLFGEIRNVGFTFQGDSISPKQDGNYTIFFSYSFQGTVSQTDLYRIGTFVDGVKEYSTSRTASGTNNGGVPYPVNVYLNAGQWVSFRVENVSDASRDCVFTDGTVTINYAQ